MSFTTFVKERFWQIVFVLAVLYFLLLIRNDIVQNSRLNKEIRSLRNGLEEEKSKSIELKFRMRSLKKSSYLEEMARDRLGYVERGETPYKVIIK